MKLYSILTMVLVLFAPSLKLFAQDQTEITDPFVITDSLKNYFVEKALAYSPTYKAFEARVRQQDLKYDRSRRAYLDQFSLSTQYNSVYNQVEQSYAFIPRAGVGVSVNVGSLVNQRLSAKIAREDYEVALADLNNYKVWLRAEVLRRLTTYHNALQIVQLHRHIAANSKLMFKFVEKQYSNAEISYTEYGQAYRSYLDNQERRIRSESELESAEAGLLELIGSWD